MSNSELEEYKRMKTAEGKASVAEFLRALNHADPTLTTVRAIDNALQLEDAKGTR